MSQIGDIFQKLMELVEEQFGNDYKAFEDWMASHLHLFLGHVKSENLERGTTLVPHVPTGSNRLVAYDMENNPSRGRHLCPPYEAGVNFGQHTLSSTNYGPYNMHYASQGAEGYHGYSNLVYPTSYPGGYVNSTFSPITVPLGVVLDHQFNNYGGYAPQYGPLIPPSFDLSHTYMSHHPPVVVSNNPPPPELIYGGSPVPPRYGPAPQNAVTSAASDLQPASGSSLPGSVQPSNRPTNPTNASVASRVELPPRPPGTDEEAIKALRERLRNARQQLKNQDRVIADAKRLYDGAVGAYGGRGREIEELGGRLEESSKEYARRVGVAVRGLQTGSFSDEEE